MDLLIISVSLIALVVGFFYLTEAALGVGIIATVGVLGVNAWIAQASVQRRKLAQH